MKRLRIVKHYSLIVVLMIFILISCRKDESLTNDKNQGVEKIDGYVQKGPFISGSSITIQELNDDLSPSGVMYSTVTNDDFGSFVLSTEINSNYVEIISQGFYFNEVSGNLSNTNISLRTISISSDTININILTTLSRDRIIYLVNENKTVQEAMDLAQEEILSSFGINATDVISFDKMNFSQEGESNAILLAISATLQANNTEAELSELISKFSLDLKTDGIIQDSSIITTIRQNATGLILSQIRDNIETRYANLGMTLSVPKFEDYIDSDGDGTINMLDDSTYIWMHKTANWTPRFAMKSIVYYNKIWLFGGITTDEHLTEVLCSEDGLSWEQVSNNCPYSLYNTFLSFDDNIWVFKDGFLNSNSIIISNDGITWNAVDHDIDAAYESKKINSCIVFKNSLYLFLSTSNNSSFSGNEIWKSSNGISWQLISNSPIYGQVNDCKIVVYDNKIILIGFGREFPDYEGIWISEDGINWEKVVNNFQWNLTGSSPIKVVIYNEEIWLFNTPSPNEKIELWTSIDGINWVRKNKLFPFKTNYSYDCIVFENKLFIYGGVFLTNYSGTISGCYNDIWYLVNYLDL